MGGSSSSLPSLSCRGSPRPLAERSGSTRRAFLSRVLGRPRPALVYVPDRSNRRKSSNRKLVAAERCIVWGERTQQHHAPTYPKIPFPGGWADPRRNRGGRGQRMHKSTFPRIRALSCAAAASCFEGPVPSILTVSAHSSGGGCGAPRRGKRESLFQGGNAQNVHLSRTLHPALLQAGPVDRLKAGEPAFDLCR